MKRAVLNSVKCFCGAVFLSSVASANGRYPAADQLALDPLDPAHYVVRTTFGLLETADAGATWSWVCEAALTGEILGDPPIAVSAGATIVGLGRGVSVGDRTGCTWTEVTEGFDGHRVVDLVVDPTRPSRILAVQEWPAEAGPSARVLESIDDGRHWSTVGPPIDGIRPSTLEVARSRPARLYVGGPSGGLEAGVVAVSDDAGATWTRKSFPGVYVYVSGVDPLDPDRLYARVDGSRRSQLFVSEDAATSWTLLVDSPVGLKGFALSLDGTRVAAGSDADGVVVFTRVDADAGTSTFTMGPYRRMSSRCLQWGAAGLFICADEALDGFTVGLSPDGDARFAPLLHLAALAPAACSADASSSVCASSWCGVRSTLPVDAGCASDAGEDRTSPTDADTDASMTPATNPPSSGCGCHAPSARAKPWRTLAALLCIGSAAAMRRRQKSRM